MPHGRAVQTPRPWLPGKRLHGPIREYYLVGQHDTPDTSRWRTQIGWPIFLTRTA
jgi:hypothetical protein